MSSLNFERQVFVLTGKTGNLERSAVVERIERANGLVGDAVTSSSDILVCRGYPTNAPRTTKRATAERMGCRILSDTAFLLVLHGQQSLSAALGQPAPTASLTPAPAARKARTKRSAINALIAKMPARDGDYGRGF